MGCTGCGRILDHQCSQEPSALAAGMDNMTSYFSGRLIRLLNVDSDAESLVPNHVAIESHSHHSLRLYFNPVFERIRISQTTLCLALITSGLRGGPTLNLIDQDEAYTASLVNACILYLCAAPILVRRKVYVYTCSGCTR